MVKLSFAPEEDTSKDVFLEIRQREIYLHARDMIEADLYSSAQFASLREPSTIQIQEMQAEFVWLQD